MNARQERFCLEYASSGNASQAMIKAGYSAKYAGMNADKLLKNTKVIARLKEITEQLETEKIAQASEMQATLTKIIRQQIKEEVIVVEGCGDGVSQSNIVEKNASLKDIINAVDKLAKMQGLYTDGNSTNIVVPIYGGEDCLED